MLNSCFPLSVVAHVYRLNDRLGQAEYVAETYLHVGTPYMFLMFTTTTTINNTTITIASLHLYLQLFTVSSVRREGLRGE